MSEKTTKVILHGYLKDLYKGEIRLNAANLAELVNGFSKQTKAFRPKPGQLPHQVRVIGFDTVEDIYHKPLPDEVHIVPDFSGNKGSFAKILLGGLIVLAAVVIGPGALGFAYNVMIGMGASAIFGGILELLSPAPKMDISSEDKHNYLPGYQNTVRIGTRIPLLVGEHIAYGHFLSFNVDTKVVSS